MVYLSEHVRTRQNHTASPAEPFFAEMICYGYAWLQSGTDTRQTMRCCNADLRCCNASGVLQVETKLTSRGCEPKNSTTDVEMFHANGGSLTFTSRLSSMRSEICGCTRRLFNQSGHDKVPTTIDHGLLVHSSPLRVELRCSN